MPLESAPRRRDAEATRKRILQAAIKGFATRGLSGARVDEIAARARVNKRMIYHYFGSKEQLFQAAVEEAYAGIREAEQKLDLHKLTPREALETLVTFTWNYYLRHPEFLSLVNSENLHRARHVKKSTKIAPSSQRLVEAVAGILKRGVDNGDFREGVDAVQLTITIAAIGYYYLTNRYTGAVLYQRNFMEKEALDERLAFNVQTILRLVAA